MLWSRTVWGRSVELGAPVNRRILDTIVPYLDDPGAYSAAEDRGALSILAEARVVRRSLLQAKALPDQYHAQRASALESGLARVPGSSLLQKRYRRVILSWARSTHRRHGDPADMERIYRRGLACSPGLGEAAVELAILYGDQGRFADAYEALKQASSAGVGSSVDRVRQELRAVERGRHGDGRPPQSSER